MAAGKITELIFFIPGGVLRTDYLPAAIVDDILRRQLECSAVAVSVVRFRVVDFVVPVPDAVVPVVVGFSLVVSVVVRALVAVASPAVAGAIPDGVDAVPVAVDRVADATVALVDACARSVLVCADPERWANGIRALANGRRVFVADLDDRTVDFVAIVQVTEVTVISLVLLVVVVRLLMVVWWLTMDNS